VENWDHLVGVHLPFEKELTELSDNCVLMTDTSKVQVSKPVKKTIEWMSWNQSYGFLANEFLDGLINFMPSIFECQSVDDVDYRIRAGLIKTFDRFVPSRMLTIRNGKMVTKNNMSEKQKKIYKRMRKIWNRFQTRECWNHFVKASRELRREVCKVRGHT